MGKNAVFPFIPEVNMNFLFQIDIGLSGTFYDFM